MTRRRWRKRPPDALFAAASVNCITSLVALSMIGGPAGAQTVPTPTTASPDPVGGWFSRHNVSVRKVFDGTKDEQNPASLFYAREPTGRDREFSSIDVAVKVSEWELLASRPSSSLLVYPVVDYHRSTNAGKLVNKAGAAARIEFRPVGLWTPSGADTAGTAVVPGTWWRVAPTFILDGKLARDWQGRTNETRVGLQVFPTSNLRGLPGSNVRNRRGAYLGRYYPYVGVEHYRFGGAAADTSVAAAYARLWLEAWPITTPTQQFLQLTAELTSRHRLSGDRTMPRQLSDAALGANLYLDGNGHVAIGVDYANGRDATQRFARRERTSAGLKIKF